jgi:hypothetical protein
VPAQGIGHAAGCRMAWLPDREIDRRVGRVGLNARQQLPQTFEGVGLQQLEARVQDRGSGV